MNEIEKMAEIICEAYTPKQKPQELRYADVYRFKPTATALVNAGYGDIKQAVREFAEKLERKIGALTVADDETYWFKCGFETLQEHLPEIIKEVLKEVCGE